VQSTAGDVRDRLDVDGPVGAPENQRVGGSHAVVRASLNIVERMLAPTTAFSIPPLGD